MWSLGAVFTDFFRPLKEQLDDAGEWDDNLGDGPEGGDQQHEDLPFSFLHGAPPTGITSWRRVSLFNADRGDIGLAWSIFKVRGTPNGTNWPVNVVNTSTHHQP
jgi:cyclin-dependent kinase 8/11